MPLFVWTDDMSVGVDDIDADHRLLVNLINELHEAVKDGEAKADVGSVLSVLLDYTSIHFRREELMMQACGYPDLENHKKGHQALRQRVEQIRDEYVDAEGSGLETEVLEFLRDWLIHHILGEDKLYKHYMQCKPEVVAEVSRRFSATVKDRMGFGSSDKEAT